MKILHQHIKNSLKPQYIALSFLCLLLMFTLGCSTAKSALKVVGLGSNNTLKHIAIESLVDSNLGSPVAVDIVFIKDNNITPLLSSLSGPDWFKDKSALSKRYHQQIDIVSLEVVRLSFIQSLTLPKKSKYAVNVLLFANYRSKDGQYVAELGHFKQLRIRLLRNSYELIEGG